MWEKTKSRKFVMAVAAGLLVVANDGLGLGLPEDSIMAIVGVVASYIIGQGVVDAAAAKAETKE